MLCDFYCVSVKLFFVMCIDLDERFRHYGNWDQMNECIESWLSCKVCEINIFLVMPLGVIIQSVP